MNAITLLKNCPAFYRNYAPESPWENQDPDVESIHREACDGICKLIKDQSYQLNSKNPKLGSAAIVWGEAGSGKTHFLRRILKKSFDEETLSVFTHVRPIIDPNAPNRHLLKAIVTDLSMPLNDGVSQLQRLTSKIIVEYLQSINNCNEETLELFQNTQINEIKDKWSAGNYIFDNSKGAINYIHNKTNINKDILKVIFLSISAQNRGIVNNWLMGELIDDEDLKELGVIGKRTDKTEEFLENEAFQLINALNYLFIRYKLSTLICFDQLDVIKSKELIFAFGVMLSTIIDYNNGFIPIVFVKADTWNNRFKPSIEPSIVEKLHSNLFILKGCSVGQAHEIIKSRLLFFLKDDWQSAYNLLISKIGDKLEEGDNPRRIIILANREIQKIISDSGDKFSSEGQNPIQILQERYFNECDIILSEISNYPEDSDLLIFALENFLANYENVTEFKRVYKEKINFYCSLSDTTNDIENFALIINTKSNHIYVGKCFDEGIEFLTKNQNAKCAYITDPRSIFSKKTWNKTNQKRIRFEELGGKIWQLKYPDASRWYALSYLIYKVYDGDLTYETENGMILPITETHLNEFIKNKENFGKPFIPIDDDNNLVEDIKKLLQDSPMHMLTTKILNQSLSQRYPNVSHEILLELCGKQKEIFLILPTPTGSSIMLRRII